MKSLPLIVMVAALVLGGCKLSKMPQPGEPLLPFKAATLAGETVELPAAGAGRVTLLRFWATWCRYCKEEMRDVDEVWKDYRDKGLAVFAVNSGQTPAQIEPFVREIGVGYPILLDPETEITRGYGVTALPITFVVGRDGTVKRRVIGEIDVATWRKIVEGLL
jgi:cytochrome c biogenesis protein CcmG, thiol:disulfide interchange protein DsbE